MFGRFLRSNKKRVQKQRLRTEVTCPCGNTMEFEGGWIPESFICANCGNFLALYEDVQIEFPNLHKSKFKVIKGGKI